MSQRTLHICPSTLANGYETYSPKATKELFLAHKTSPYLDFAVSDEKAYNSLASGTEALSISGVQEKFGAVISNGHIQLTTVGEQSTHILKPAPLQRINYRKELPANENLTMQIARQCYGIETAVNGLCFSTDNQVVYITRRYDILPDNSKLKQEDFCTLTNHNEQTEGADFKYNGSYEDIAKAIRQHIPAWPVTMERFFRIVVFNYIYGNGDAHLKNFSILYKDEDILLAPAYDLINTELHLHGTDFGLRDGLDVHFEKSDCYSQTGHPCQDDFRHFAEAIGLNEKRTDAVLQQFCSLPDKVQQLIDNSYLSTDKLKRSYRKIIEERTTRFLRKDG